MNIQNILFDLDGTLTDPLQGVKNGILYSLAQMGRSIPENFDFRVCIGPPLHETIGGILNATSDSLEVSQALKYYRSYYESHGLYENELYKNIPEMLESLSSCFKLYLATSKLETFAKEVLRHFAIDSFFSGIFGSQPDNSNTDKVELIDHIIKSTHILPSQTVMIGDRKFDGDGAVANQIMFYGVLWGYGSRDELLEHGALHLIQSPTDLVYLMAME
jgi:phosphoglycolate phosphatase